MGIVCGETPQIITYNNITNNRIGIDCWWSNVVNYLNPLITINATWNWCGDLNGPHDPSSGPPDYNWNPSGDKVSDYVIYRPWAPSPIEDAGPQ